MSDEGSDQYGERHDEGDRRADRDFLADRFEGYRGHLRSVAYRMLGSAAEAEDAVQEAWFRLHRSDTREVENLGGWLTTVVGRVCLDMLRSRRTRGEEPLDTWRPAPSAEPDPAQDAVLADSVGLALLVVLDTLSPAERLAFVLHDLFGVPFEEIGGILGRSPAAARQLASRARRRVRGADAPETDLARQREVVDAFLAAARGGDFDGLLAVLDPDVVARSEAGVTSGAAGVAAGAASFARLARIARPALVDGATGLVVLVDGRPERVLTFAFAADRITVVDIVTDPARLAELTVEPV
ncbi:RNA polymerase sigma-70 factor, ECF subfamily [Streptomyces sp. 1222.5]|uniref:sigma-70 family RNA polymerase sigma factor n=1 Tax=unclassified Streptomyces TaxID=2593676 RepID=UPI0008992303|nr:MULTISPECIES: sigma-70 family RNA polymerase sigma factor [unclassified Streptomyces]PKW09166.1 RNA polymerase sigma-70 factor (ECF subfamily) [Streptomyces sp. 5112.2]SEC42757.1 RNA polymerase sigma-70 factor, ECF subfamily [Streptomyces sp. 1222.5]SED47605.1 RNA polymerase sigma-70 factor, ECF subfamily [Streptomyces sp. 2231.1]